MDVVVKISEESDEETWLQIMQFVVMVPCRMAETE